MAVAFDASSESHTGTTGATAPFSWTHTPSGSPKGVLVFSFVNGDSADSTIGVSYGGYGLVPVSGGRAVDTAGESGDCKAWLLSPWSFAPAVSTSATSNTANGLRAATYGGGYYVASGSSGTIIYKATDPTGSWSEATSGTANNLTAATYGNGYFVSAGLNGTIIYKATDPTGSWSAATSNVPTVDLQGVDYGNGYYVAVGLAGNVRYKATDPTGSWSGATSGTANNLLDVAYGGGYWVAVGSSGTIIYKATDPTGSWSAATSGTGNTLRSVTYANGYWVACGDSGTILYKSGSNPSGSWSAATSGTTAAFRGVAFGEGYWIALGGTTSYSTTPDGSWRGVATTIQASSSAAAIIYDDAYFLAVGQSGSINYGQVPVGPLTLPTGAQTVVVNTQSGNETYAVAITVTADYGVEASGVVLQQGDQTLANTAVDDGSPGTNSVRFAGLFSGLAAVPSANAGSTELQNIDFGNQVISVIRETTAGQGSRSIGWTAASDDVAAVYLAIREAIVPWTVGVPIR